MGSEMIDKKEHTKIMAEYDALIAQAWGEVEGEGSAVKHDPALARNLEWLRDSYLALYQFVVWPSLNQNPTKQ